MVIAEKYEVGELIASGRDGDLYRATHVLTGKPATLRLLPRSVLGDLAARAAFFEEAKATARVEHPNILNVTDLGTDSAGETYAVCEPSGGETLKNMIGRETQLAVDDAVSIALQIAAGLSAAHAAGVIHGNLTPHHVLVGEGHPVKVSGFGTRNPMARNEDSPGIAASDFAYLAPEQCSGAEFGDERGDIYSLGVLFYEMLAGTVPFTGEKPTDVILKHIEEMPAPLVAFREDLPPWIEPVILKALAKAPELRYGTADEFIADLNAAAVPTAAAAAAGEEKQPQSIWVTVAMVVIGISALAGALIYATSVKQTDPSTALQPDANGMPVQPISPPTGIEEQSLAAMPAMTDSAANTALTPPDTLPGGDGYNPWATGAPPGGMPEYIPPGGEVYTVPGGGSQFMPNCVMQPSGVMLCYGTPPANSNVRPTPTPRTTPNANTNVEPAASPAATPQSSPTPTRPAATPRTSPTPASRPSPAADRPPNGDGN